jgi:hypothetical protein
LHARLLDAGDRAAAPGGDLGGNQLVGGGVPEAVADAAQHGRREKDGIHPGGCQQQIGKPGQGEGERHRLPPSEPIREDADDRRTGAPDEHRNADEEAELSPADAELAQKLGAEEPHHRRKRGGGGHRRHQGYPEADAALIGDPGTRQEGAISPGHGAGTS